LLPDQAAGLGPAQAVRHSVRPGIVSLHQLRRRLGIAYRTELAHDAEMVYTDSTPGRLGLALRALLLLPFGSRRGGAAASRLHLLGVTLHNGEAADTVDWLTRRTLEGRRTLSAFANADCLNIAFRDAAYRGLLAGMDRVLPDGVGVRLASRMRGTEMRDNLNGTDLFPMLCECLAEQGLPLFLLGARPGVAQAAAANMQARFPKLRVAGTHHGFFAAADEPALIAGINASGAAVLLVALGAPRQEAWLTRHAPALEPPLLMGVGGLFDYYSERIRRAPAWVREIGMEWAWRVYQEPGRLWRRYVIGNPLFLWRVWREARRARAVKPGSAGKLPLRLNEPSQAWLAARTTRLCRRFGLAAGRVAKRALDAGLAGTLLVALAPLLGTVAVLIRLESPGPALFRQTRVGLHGKPFSMLKFRSMYADAEQRRRALEADNEMAGGVLFKMKRDPRITRLGRLIRRTSIDELPQLWNVLRGDMALVGPRPALPSEVDVYRVTERRRLDAKPGITCLWQVSGRSELAFNEQVRLDVDYIHAQSLRTDLQIMLRTLPAVISGRGAY
jgi:exopolysaccharide biosynthesis WecB/TagA/CpsF family protein